MEVNTSSTVAVVADDNLSSSWSPKQLGFRPYKPVIKILHVDRVFGVLLKDLYIVKDILGQGTFGQVAKCWVAELDHFVAVKIIKNQPAYYLQALVEVSILTILNKKFDPEDKHHIVRIYDFFVYQRHLCISFELLDTNFYDLKSLSGIIIEHRAVILKADFLWISSDEGCCYYTL